MFFHRKHIATLLLALAMLLVLAAPALACPTCKEAVGNEQSNLVNGYFWSIVFMMSMPFLIFSGISLYFYYLIRTARKQPVDSASVTAA